MTRIKFRYSEIKDEIVLGFDEIFARQSFAIVETFYFSSFYATSPLAPFGGDSTLARRPAGSLFRPPYRTEIGVFSV